MKEYYVTWVNEDQNQIEGRKPHNEIRDGGEMTEAETAEEAIENVRQWIIEGEYAWFNDFGEEYARIEIDEDSGDIIVWGIVDGNRKFIHAYVDLQARIENEEKGKSLCM